MLEKLQEISEKIGLIASFINFRTTFVNSLETIYFYRIYLDKLEVMTCNSFCLNGGKLIGQEIFCL